MYPQNIENLKINITKNYYKTIISGQSQNDDAKESQERKNDRKSSDDVNSHKENSK